MAGHPFVSIIIPALNEEKTIVRTLEAIGNLETSTDQYEVILVDNGSTDSTVDVARGLKKKFRLTVLSKSDGNISALRNYGAKFATGSILAFLDADCIVEKNWLPEAVRAFNELGGENKRLTRESVAAVGASHQIPEDSSWVAKVWHLKRTNDVKPREARWLPSGNMFVLKEAFAQIGGFDEGLETNEDCDLCYRLTEGGYKIFSVPTVKAVHLRAPQTMREFFRKELWHGKDVFKVFLESGVRFRNLRAVGFALFYVACLVGVGIGLVLCVVGGSCLPMLTSVLLSLAFPSLLALRTCCRKKQYRSFLPLVLIYSVYGVARAFCVLNFRWLQRRSIK